MHNLISANSIAKSNTLAELGVAKLRPNHVKQEKESLYEDVLDARVIANDLKDENKKLKTKIAILERQMNRREKVIDGLVGTPQSNRHSFIPSPNPRKEEAEEITLISKLKRMVKELQ